MEQANLLKELIHQIKDNKLLSDCGNAARTSGINGGENNKAGANDEVTHPVTLEGTTKEDVMQMVEATAMVYKVMEEQHKMDSFVPKEPTILKDEMRLNEFALQLCCTHGIVMGPLLLFVTVRLALPSEESELESSAGTSPVSLTSWSLFPVNM
jgi:hypothetical protein